MSNQRLFEVGDKVRAPHFKGVLEVAEVREVDAYPIVIYSRNSNVLFYYTDDGKSSLSHSESTLRHADTGIPARVGEPPERFEYPLYMSNGYYTVEFTELTVGTVVASDAGGPDVGYSFNRWSKHTDRSVWTPCDKPKWQPTKPTWCWVWDWDEERSLHLVTRWCESHPHCSSKAGYNYVTYIPDSHRVFFRNAEPCEPDDIPNYWPKEWT